MGGKHRREESISVVSSSSPKRRKSANDYASDRSRTAHQWNRRQGSRAGAGAVNAGYGQSSALPGLDDGDSFNHGDEETEDALAYLRSVRSEANGIPHVMNAPKLPIDDEEYSDDDIDYSKGWYEDGAYIAFPEISDSELPDSNIGEDVKVELSPQEAFTKDLLTRYQRQKAFLQKLCASQTEKPDSIVNFPFNSVKGYPALAYMIHNRDPSSKELCGLSQTEILKLLPLLSQMLKKFVNIEPRVSAWIWGFLCRLEEVGTLHSDEVSVLREFGKRAVKVGISFFNREAALVLGDDDDDHEGGVYNEEETYNDETVGQDGLDAQHEDNSEPFRDSLPLEKQKGQTGNVTDADETALEEAKQRLLGSIPKGREPEVEPETLATHANENTRATLDTIITIIGEAYGQRDLLEFRTVWAGENGLWG